MKYAVKLPSKDDLTIGPFETYDDAAVWANGSIFSHEPHEIIAMVEPRPDHRPAVRRPMREEVTYGRSIAERDADRKNLEWMIETSKQGKP